MEHENTSQPSPAHVYIVSHGPGCLDGVTAAVSVARYHAGATLIPCFASTSRIDEVLRSINPDEVPTGSEVWITDISWTQEETNDHLRQLAARGIKLYWFDHHRTAISRHANGAIHAPFTDYVLSEAVSGARLVYEYLEKQLAASGGHNEAFTAFAPVVAQADDNDRWIHAISGSRELALTVSTLAGTDDGNLDAYHALLNIDADITYSPAMRAAYEKSTQKIKDSFALAQRSKVRRSGPDGAYSLVCAVCDGYSSEIGDSWGKQATNTVFVFYDRKNGGVSLRRSPDCQVDLSELAQMFGGGGHPAASGCRPQELPELIARSVAGLFASGLQDLLGPDCAADPD
jgi:oligoribonuclease NrnB/cAMP/cGMP phosphodiesterase (DHH superfamily)